VSRLPTIPLHRLIGSVLIVDAKRNPAVVAEVEFRQIPVQMLLGAVLINALHVALEDAVVPFPDYPAPVVRTPDGERELNMMRWGMPPPPKLGGPPVTNIRNTASSYVRPAEAGRPM
jgi:putative SOS response-associated peptidase YedK